MTNLIKKIRKFYYSKDPLLDHYITNHFYSKEIPYLKKRKMFEKTETFYLNMFSLDNSSKKLVRNHSEIENYIINDFQVYYVCERAEYVKHSFNYFKRIHIIFLFFCFNIFLILNPK